MIQYRFYNLNKTKKNVFLKYGSKWETLFELNPEQKHSRQNLTSLLKTGQTKPQCHTDK